MNNRKLISLFIPLAPALSFIFIILCLFYLKEADASEFIKVLGIAHIFGGLVGIGVGLFFLEYPCRYLLEVIISAYLFFLGVSYFYENNLTISFLIVSSFLSTFSDVFYKKYSINFLLKGRFIQSFFWTLSSLMLIYGLTDISQVIFMRIICLLSGTVGLYKLLYFEYKKYSFNDLWISIKKCFYMYLWMLSSNVIFIAPSFLLSSVGGAVNVLIAYIFQVSLQIAGRVSDYSLSISRLGIEKLNWFRSKIFILVLSILFCILTIKNNEINKSLIIFYLMAVSAGVLMWSEADSFVAIKIYSGIVPVEAISKMFLLITFSTIFQVFIYWVLNGDCFLWFGLLGILMNSLLYKKIFGGYGKC